MTIAIIISTTRPLRRYDGVDVVGGIVCPRSISYSSIVLSSTVNSVSLQGLRSSGTYAVMGTATVAADHVNVVAATRSQVRCIPACAD